MKKLVLILLSILFLVGCGSNAVKDTITNKVNEFKGFGNNYTVSEAKEDGFFVEGTIPDGAPEQMIKFIECIWHGKDADASIAKEKSGALILSYLIYRNNTIHVLDYNVQDETFKTSEYKYLTYDYDIEKGVQSRYLTNDKSLKGKDKLTDEQKSNCYYLCSYLIPEN